MLKKSIFYFLALTLTSHALAAKPAPKIQIALLLDASGSMNGLITQAQTKLWSLVNEMALAKKRGQTPKLEVALYMYGHSSLSSRSGYVRCLQELTTDLDAVSEALFKITTNGGDEYCGQVIQAATTLNWSTNPKDYKAIFIAGNEPFNQGSVDFRAVCRDTIAKGIVVNTIFCGNEQEGIRTHWKEGATLTDGRFMTLNHNAAMVHVSAPQDAEMIRLSTEMNKTFLGYGAQGQTAKTRQKRQDQNARRLNREASVARAVAKASPAYEPEAWDLVTAASNGAVELNVVAEEELPQELKGKTDAEKQAIVKDLAKKREEIKKKISELEKARAAYLANQPKAEGQLDDVMLEAIRKQLQAQQFDLPKKQ